MILIEEKENPYLMGQINKQVFKCLESRSSKHLLLGEFAFLSTHYFIGEMEIVLIS